PVRHTAHHFAGNLFVAGGLAFIENERDNVATEFISLSSIEPNLMAKRLFWLALSAALVGVWACGPRPTEVGTTTAEVVGGVRSEPVFSRVVPPETGIVFPYHKGEAPAPPVHSILEAIGGGIALLDYDGDGLLDIYIPGGGYFAGPNSREIRGH